MAEFPEVEVVVVVPEKGRVTKLEITLKIEEVTIPAVPDQPRTEEADGTQISPFVPGTPERVEIQKSLTYDFTVPISGGPSRRLTGDVTPYITATQATGAHAILDRLFPVAQARGAALPEPEE